MFVLAVIAGGSQKVQSRVKKPEDRIQGYFIFLTTAAETTVEGDEILVLGTMQWLLSCMRMGYWLSVLSSSRMRIQEEEGPSAAGAVAGVEGTCASNPQQDSEKLKEKQEEEKHDDYGSHQEEEEGEEDGGEDPINDNNNNNNNDDDNIIRANFQTWILYHHP